MAIGSIPPWVRGPDTLGALSSGASAGAAAGRMEQENRFESARLGMEAQRMQQNAALQQAQLAQAAQQHEMEFQAQSKLAEQNQLRQEQRLNIDNAYKTAALGIAKGRLEETQQAAADKARAAALTFQHEQGFTKYVGETGDVLGGLQRFPRVSSSYAGIVSRAQSNPNLAILEGAHPILGINRKTGEVNQLYTPPEKQGLSKVETEQLKDLRHDRDQLEKETPRSDDEKQLTQDKLNAIRYRIDRLSHGKSLTPHATSTGTISTESKSRAPKAGEIYSGHKFKGGDPSDQNNWEEVQGGGE